jgi:hypothetical protein
MHIHGSVIEKCGHGIYLASPEEVSADRATYCGICTPDSDTRQTARDWNPTVQANPVLKRHYDSTSCPACGCDSHHIDGKMWVCTDCRNEWLPPRGLRNSKAFVSIRRVES